jgi:hypothetical protein
LERIAFRFSEVKTLQELASKLFGLVQLLLTIANILQPIIIVNKKDIQANTQNLIQLRLSFIIKRLEYNGTLPL